MKPSQIDKTLPLLADLSFALYLITEVLFEHSMLSQLCMLLFFAVVILYCIRRKRLFFSWWIAASALVILWGVIVSFGWASDRAVSLDMTKTLVVNAVFFFFLFQYLLLQGDMRRYITAFVLSISLLSAYALIREIPFDFENVRVGIAAGINPNWLGMLAAIALSLTLVLVKQKGPLWLLTFLPLVPMVVFSESVKAMALAALLFVVVYLIVYPKRWWLKLLGLLVIGATAFYFLIFQENNISNGLFHRLQIVAHYTIMGWGRADSVMARDSLITVAMDAFRLRPITGYGLGCFRFLEGAGGTYSHNNFTEVLVSGGAVFFTLYYLPQLIALALSSRTLARQKRTGMLSQDVAARAGIGVFMALVVAQIIMDYGMVSYFDRTAAVYFILLVAAERIGRNRASDGERFFTFLKNPRILFIWLAERGFFRKMDDETYLKRFYRARFGKELHLNPPVTMNEKIQWLKLHDRDEAHVRLVDKVSVRDYVADKVGAAVLVEQLGVWNRAEEIDFDLLPERFVLKCTHNSGGVIVCPDKSKLDRAGAVKKLAAQLKKNYYDNGREWLYKNVTPRVVAEAFIGSADGTLPDDYKFFCFDGVARAICVCTNRSGKHADYFFFNRDFQRLPVNEATANLPEDFVFPKPARYEEMLRVAEALSNGIKHVRVDLYDTEQGVRFGELTFFDQSGFADDYVGDGDRIMGEFLKLEEQA